MYEGTNPSALRSRETIAKACLSLMQQTPYQQISVKQIMQRTDLVRQTFYQIFDSKDEILEYILDTFFMEYIHSQNYYRVSNLCETAHLFFRFFGQYESYIQLLIKNGQTDILQNKCQEYLCNWDSFKYVQNDVLTVAEKELATAFTVNGMVGMYVNWVRTKNTKVSLTELADLVCRLTSSQIQNNFVGMTEEQTT